ncbi:hypothetical protein HYV84_06655 [Candidatus Woesearchaeota archaeon]|nr:hypothetical protein [Candidatus Woesearchaeota archaeon]
MKHPSKMTTEELIDLADEVKRGITTSWIKRRDKLKQEAKLVLARQF